MDMKAFFKLSYGLYIISSSHEGKDAGCVVNTLQQVTNSPCQLSVAVNKENYTSQVIQGAGRFAANVLLSDINMDTLRLFGFQSSAETDKFAQVPHKRDSAGLPYLLDGIAARFSCQVKQTLDLGTHILFIGEVTEAESLSEEQVMTYAYYHQVKNGATPPKASSYQAQSEKKGWRCSVCGHVHEEDTLPDNFICPVCGQPANVFVEL